MAARKSRAGYEPGRGAPDPEDVAPPGMPQVVTHRPAGSGVGPACPAHVRGGIVPTGAHEYINILDPRAMPTCPWCANYHQAVTDFTHATQPWTRTA